jgi:phosphomevalonate kinase
MIVTRAPGKLFIAGEYAVVEPGEPAVLIAVDRYLTVRLTESADVGRVHSREYGRLPLVWTREGDDVSIVLEHQPYDYVMSAITVGERLRDELGLPPRYFDLRIESELDDASGRKFGLGSSAAVTVAVIAAMNEFYGLSLTRAERFKLALLATIRVVPTASGGDLAASTFGGWIRYTAPDRIGLRAHLDRHGVAETLTADDWAPYRADRLAPPSSLRLLVGWTGSPASTERLVDGVRQPRSGMAQPYDSFVEESRDCVDALVACLEEDDGQGVLEVVRRARRLLQRLGATSGISIETDELRLLCDVAERHGAAGKPSGAGGGDCGIVLAPAGAPLGALLTSWETHDIRRLTLAVHPPEGRIDER